MNVQLSGDRFCVAAHAHHGLWPLNHPIHNCPAQFRWDKAEKKNANSQQTITNHRITYFLIGKIYRENVGTVTNTSLRLMAVMIRLATSRGSNIDMFFGLQPANMPVFMKYGQTKVI